jgi:hypothetical protein
VTVSPPVYVDITVSFTYTKLNQYTSTEVETAIKNRLLTDFGYVGMNFQDTIYPQDLEFVLQQVPGVKTARVTQLFLTGGSAALNASLVGGADEIFRLLEENLNITEA